MDTGSNTGGIPDAIALFLSFCGDQMSALSNQSVFAHHVQVPEDAPPTVDGLGIKLKV